MEKTFVLLVSDGKYSQIHHVGKESDVLLSFEAMRSGAKAEGLNIENLFMFEYPKDLDKIREKAGEVFDIWLSKNSIKN